MKYLTGRTDLIVKKNEDTLLSVLTRKEMNIFKKSYFDRSGETKKKPYQGEFVTNHFSMAQRNLKIVVCGNFCKVQNYRYNNTSLVYMCLVDYNFYRCGQDSSGFEFISYPHMFHI